MKTAKKRKPRKRVVRPRYTLAELLAQMPAGRIELNAELQAWEDMRPVGREVIPMDIVGSHTKAYEP